MKLTPLTFQNTKEFVGWMKKVSISMPIAKMSSYSSVPNNRVYLIIVFKGFSQLTCQRVVPNNRVERIFFWIRVNEQNVQEQDQNDLNKQNQSFDDFSNIFLWIWRICCCENYYLCRKISKIFLASAPSVRVVPNKSVLSGNFWK